MLITPAFYAHLLSPLLALASGKVAVILEGGYCLESLAESAALTLRTLLGDPCPTISTLEPPCSSIRNTILNVIYSHRPYWRCYEYQDTYSLHSDPPSNHEDNERHLPLVTFTGNEIKPTIYETRNCYPIQSETTLNDIHNRLLILKQSTNLSKAPYQVCLVYDERMLDHCNTSDATHPETPKRISGIYSKHEEYDLLKRCHIIPGRIAKETELALAHTKEYINNIRETEGKKPAELSKQARELESVYFHKDTWKSARVAAGSLLQVVDNVLNGDAQSGVAIIRPPGHHADEAEACGFCLFNNISIAARYATEFHGLSRVLVVDWDVHHGNGTQAILLDDPKILYISIHRYENGAFFPGSKNGNYDIVGDGKGEGFNVNIPWNRKRMGDAEYIAAFQQIIMPIAYQFNPELVLVSAGFDACIGDPLGGYNVSPAAYGHFTHWLSALANGKIILALEGGYNINSIAYAMTMCTKALLGDPLPPLCASGNASPCSSAVASIKNVLKVHRKYWPNLVFTVALPKEIVIPQAAFLSDNPKIVDISPDAETKIVCEEWQSEKNNRDFEDFEAKLNALTINIMKEDDKCPRQCTNTDKKAVDSNTDKDKPGCSRDSEDGAAGGACKQNLTDYLSDNFHLLNNGEMFAIIPLNDCPHLQSIGPVPATGIDINAPCDDCKSTIENWICLHCYKIYCARSINQHAIIHGQNFEHPLTLSFTDLSVWCYCCEAYIDNPRLHSAKSAAYRGKFNEELPWTYSCVELHE